MTKFTKAGLRASNRQRTKNKLRTQAGNARISMSLGALDPRLHRNPQGATLTHRRFSAQHFIVTKEGQLRPRTD